ncbi:MAG: Eco57I restriction-modification methylase domain-containing protein, partial [Anaerolineaceae bacterium]
MTAPAIIQALVNRFRDSRELYRSGRYNEAQLRQEFLNPFFEALGWDMFNRSNFAPQYREVIHEDSLEDEGSLKAPDYAFRIGTTRKFFVEAKKPKVNIRYEIDPAYQLRRYAWNAHLPLSILTDFEELAVYDCRTRPDPKDSAATGRVMLFTFEEYVDRWDELAQIFSKDAVWNGSFDRYAEGTKGKRGTTEVDAEFLKEIEQWRLLLARNIALRNFRPSAGSVIGSEAPSVIGSEARQSPSVNPSEARSIIANEATRSVQSKQSPNLHRAERQLNYAVQTTIDRILFLRICEDRQIEPADQLLQIAEGADIYAHLLILFQKADQKYNSGLFHFNKEKGQTSEPDTFTPTLQIDDKVLRQIIKSTYYPCPYMFNEIPVEILGQVYEQFLGSVIRLTPSGQAKVEQKPEVRKAGGVYYTPRYIVDYIVQNTLGRLLGENTVIVPATAPSTDPDRQVSTHVNNDAAKNSASLSDEGPSDSTLSSSFTPFWEGEQGGGDAAGVRDTSINEDGLESSRSKPVLGQETGTNKVVKPSQRGGSVSEANGGEGNFALESSRSKPVLGQETGTIGKTSTNACLTPTQALNLRVVDPACGSGSFLLGAYQYLLDWHLNYYLTHDPQSHTRGKNPPLVAAEGGEYRLTTETKKRILTSSIHGVDIDAQAVEVTKLSLLLKLLEGETGQLSLGFERVLPDLDQNIRCGNSLIGWDYFKGQMFPDEEEIQRVNPFDWQRAFPHVFAAGGFDAVIGNPPYIRQESLGEDKPYYQNIYEVFTGTADIYSYFIEKGIKLLAPGGQFSYIVANKWLRAKYGFKLRQWLKTKCIEEITDFGDLPVFTGATTYPLILRVSNNLPHFQPRVTTVDTLDFVSLQEYVAEHGEIADQTCFEESGWSLAGKQTQDLLAKLRQNSISLG